MATLRCTFLGLEAFRNSLGEGHLLQCLSQLGSYEEGLEKVMGFLGERASSSSLGLGGLMDLAIAMVNDNDAIKQNTKCL